MTARRFIITGTGRSGTGYCAALLNACGVRCGHQNVVRHEHVLGTSISWGEWEGDSTFEATPILDRLRADGARTVLVVRNPLAVMRSWLELGGFTDRMRETHIHMSRVLDKYLPSVLAQPTPIERAGHYWVEWNTLAMQHADAVFLLESMEAKALFRSLGRFDQYDDLITQAVDRRTNNRAPDKAFNLPQIEPKSMTPNLRDAITECLERITRRVETCQG